MRREVDKDSVVFLLKDQLSRSGRGPIEVWEGRVKVETLSAHSEVKQSLERYVQTVVGVARMGEFNPVKYASSIAQENRGLPPTWRSLSETIARVHDRMVETAEEAGGEVQKNLATALRTQFNEVIQRVGIRHEHQMGRTINYLLDDFIKYPISI